MKLKLNKACDISSISVLPPLRTGGSGGGMSAPSAASAAAAAQQLSQSMSQKSFSQGGGSFSQSIGSGGASFSQGIGSGGASFSQGRGGGGASFSQGRGGGGASFSQGSGGAAFSQGGGSASFAHAQSQLSQASLDENQIFAVQDDSSKRMPSFPASSASCARDESQLQLAKIPTNPIHRWTPSLPDSRCHINEEVERKFQHLASSVHKMGMVLDSVQNDVMQLNRAMKEASLDSGSIQKKFVLLEESLQKILKGQDDLKALLEGSAKGNPEHLSALNSHTSKLDEIASMVSVMPKQMQAELMQLKGDIIRIFTKEMEGVVRSIRSLDSAGLGAMQTLAAQSCTANQKPPMNQTPVAHRNLLMIPIAVADGSPLMSQGPVADGRPQRKNQTHTANGRPRRNQTAAANGRPQRKKQAAVANARAQRNQRPVANARPQRKKQAQTANGRPQMNQKPEANGKALMTQAPPVTKVTAAPPKHEQQVLAATQKAPINKMQALLSNLMELDSDDDVILKTGTTGGGKAMEEDAAEILRRARKRRRREGWGTMVTLPTATAHTHSVCLKLAAAEC